MKTHFKFNCIYCGQHMECDPELCGRQICCPSCLHRIVIPTMICLRPSKTQPLPRWPHWDTWVPVPEIEFPAAMIEDVNEPLAA